MSGASQIFPSLATPLFSNGGGNFEMPPDFFFTVNYYSIFASQSWRWRYLPKLMAFYFMRIHAKTNHVL